MRTNFTKIAIADDDIDDHMFFEMALQEVNKEAVLNQYFDGRSLLEELKRPGAELPDVIFLDLNMPRKNGFQVMEEISSHESLKDIPVIIMTTSLNMTDKKKAYDKGARMYTHKPSEFFGLINLIAHGITLKQSEPIQEAGARQTGW